MNCIKRINSLKWMLVGLALLLATSSRVYGNTSLCPQSVLSIVMIVDASGSVGLKDFNLAKDAMIYMVEQMDVGPKKVHVGVISYDHRVVPFRTLVAEDQDKDSLIKIIQDIPYTGGSTATGDALKMAQLLFTQAPRGSTPQIAVLFTDGQSNTGSSVYTAADALKSEKVEIFAVGIGPSINDRELDYVASYPLSVYKKKVSDYTQLITEMNNIVMTTCNTYAFVQPDEVARIDASQGELRNFQLDLSQLSRTVAGSAAPRAPIIVIEVTAYKGVPSVKWSLDKPVTSSSNRDSMATVEGRLNKDGSRTYYWYVVTSPSNVRLYTTVIALDPVANLFDMKMQAL